MLCSPPPWLLPRGPVCALQLFWDSVAERVGEWAGPSGDGPQSSESWVLASTTNYKNSFVGLRGSLILVVGQEIRMLEALQRSELAMSEDRALKTMQDRILDQLKVVRRHRMVCRALPMARWCCRA